MDSDSDEAGLDLFAEPADYYRPEKKPTKVQHETLSKQTLTLHLVGSSPLWVGQYGESVEVPT
jgi:nicotinamide N-methyltransferase